MPKLNSLKSAALGKLNTYTPVVIEKNVTADATGAGLSIDVPFAIDIYDVVVISTASVGSATMKLSDGTHDITDAIVCATNDAVVRAGTIDSTYSAVAKGGTLKVISNGSNDRARVYIYGVRK